jgi:uncharacterized protein DUF1330
VTVYAIAQLAIHDRERYQRYVAAFMPILIKYGGQLLETDEHPEVTEGRLDGDKDPSREPVPDWARGLSRRKLAIGSGAIAATRTRAARWCRSGS